MNRAVTFCHTMLPPFPSLISVAIIALCLIQICDAHQNLQANPVILGNKLNAQFLIDYTIRCKCVIIYLFLVPGDGGSQLEGKLDKPAVVHYVCSKKTDYWFSIWLNMELLVPIVIDCWVDNMKLTYDNVSRTTSNMPGVSLRVPDFGNSTPVEWIDPSKASAGNYFASIAESIFHLGYERNVSMRGAPYDFRKAPSKFL